MVTEGGYSVPATVMDDPSLPSLEVDGIRLHLESFGDPVQQTLIVLHGGPGADYRSLLGLKQLADQFQVVLYDQRGAGLSERVPAEKLGISGYLEELDVIVDRFGHGEHVHIIGHSWGAALLSGYLGHSPERVDRAILAEPGYLNMDEMKAWERERSRFTSGLKYHWVSLKKGFEARHVNGPDEHAPRDYVYSKMITYFLNHPDNPYHCPGRPYDAPHWRIGSLASDSIMEASKKEIDRLGAGASVFQNPVLFLAGECDTWLGKDMQSKHADLYGNAKLSVIPRAGHDMFWDNPEATLRVIREFLSD
jgi:proline iminopeptidase